MSNEQDKFKNSKRRQKDENAVSRQTKIAKSKGADISQPHKYAKRHAMDCGNPGCMLCGNPRHTQGKDLLTAQEKRLYQDVDNQPKKHSNGLLDDQEDLL